MNFEVGQVVWAKTGKDPWWPAWITDIKKKERKIYTIYLAESTKGWVSFKNVCSFKENFVLHSDAQKCIQSKTLQEAINLGKSLDEVYQFVSDDEYEKAVEELERVEREIVFQEKILLINIKEDVYFQYAKNEKRKNNFSKALELIEKAVELTLQSNKVEQDIFLAKGEILFNLKLYKQAEKHYLRSLQIWENYLPILVNLGEIYHKLGLTAKSLSVFQQAIQIDPEFEDIYISQGCVYFELQDYRMAVQNFDKALQIDPSNTLTLINKAEALNKDRLFARALQTLEQVQIENDQEDLELDYYLEKFNSYQGLKNLPEMKNCIQKIVQINPLCEMIPELEKQISNLQEKITQIEQNENQEVKQNQDQNKQQKEEQTNQILENSIEIEKERKIENQQENEKEKENEKLNQKENEKLNQIENENKILILNQKQNKQNSFSPEIEEFSSEQMKFFCDEKLETERKSSFANHTTPNKNCETAACSENEKYSVSGGVNQNEDSEFNQFIELEDISQRHSNKKEKLQNSSKKLPSPIKQPAEISQMNKEQNQNNTYISQQTKVLQEEQIDKKQNKEQNIQEKKNKIIQEENNKIIQEENNKIIQEEKNKFIQEEINKIIQEENNKIIQEENNKIIQDDKNKIIQEENNEIIQEDKNKIIQQEQNKIIQEEKNKIIQEQYSKMVQEQNKMIQEQNLISLPDQSEKEGKKNFPLNQQSQRKIQIICPQSKEIYLWQKISEKECFIEKDLVVLKKQMKILIEILNENDSFMSQVSEINYCVDLITLIVKKKFSEKSVAEKIRKVIKALSYLVKIIPSVLCVNPTNPFLIKKKKYSQNKDLQNEIQIFQELLVSNIKHFIMKNSQSINHQ